MTKEEVDIDFEFSNGELANFLENFAEKIRNGEVGLSFKGRSELNIEPTRKNQGDMEYFEAKDRRQLELKIKLIEDIETTDEGRRKIEVEVV